VSPVRIRAARDAFQARGRLPGGSTINMALANGVVARPYGSGAKDFVDAINVVEGRVGLKPGKFLGLSDSPFLTHLP